MKGIYGCLAALAMLLAACAEGIDMDAAQSGNAAGQRWDTAYGGADKSYDTELLQLRAQIAPRFQTLTFEDSETGKNMTYSLFVPPNYDQSQNYPLVLFMADGSTTGKGPQAPLMQGYGGIIWATDASQAKHPCFVLVPSYVSPDYVVDDYGRTSYEVEMTLRLLQSVVGRYNIDRDRLYATGQSMGGMMSFYFNAMHPSLFAASIFVASQWDTYMLSPLVDKKFFYIVSAGDSKASVGMRDVARMLLKNGVIYGYKEFSAKLPAAEKEQLVRTLLAEGRGINFIQFTNGTVVPDGSENPADEHMYSFDYAYKLETVRDWLFQQSTDSFR